MKYIITLGLILSVIVAKSQYKLSWAVSNENLSFLKKETNLKLEFNLDSFSVNEMRNDVNPRTRYLRDTIVSKNAKYYANKPLQLKETIKTKFEENFNLESGKKFTAKADLTTNLYSYTLKITPIKFYLFMEEYLPDPKMSYYHCFSYYMKGDYLMELYNNTGSAPLITFKLTNLTNKHPMCSDCSSKNKYSQDENEEINRNMLRAGTESAKYILKLIKRSK